MDIGDYVRTDNGLILKIKTMEDIYTNNDIFLGMVIYDDKGHFVNDVEIVKSSSNIIDLIEEDDYVNGSRVIFVDKKDKHITVSCSVSENGLFYEEDIKSIVTREQFESMEYKIGE